jgi:hypothetical protein
MRPDVVHLQDDDSAETRVNHRRSEVNNQAETRQGAAALHSRGNTRSGRERDTLSGLGDHQAVAGKDYRAVPLGNKRSGVFAEKRGDIHVARIDD